RGQLDEPEVAAKAHVVAAKPLEADDAGRPRAEPRLAHEPRGDAIRRPAPELLEVERPAEAHERRAAARAEPEPAQLRGREAAELRGARRLVQAGMGRGRGADHRALDLPGAACGDELPRDRSQQAVPD